jgi:DNA-binding MarR family transcriptional regulator
MTSPKPRRQAASSQSPDDAAARYVLEDQIGFRLRKSHQRASEIFHQVMGRFDITPTQFAALAKLDDIGPVSQNQLGRHTAMDPATIFGVVGRLMKRGLVRQSLDKTDARLVIIELTLEGRSLIKEMKAVGAQVSSVTLAPLSAEEARTLNSLLQKIG